MAPEPRWPIDLRVWPARPWLMPLTLHELTGALEAMLRVVNAPIVKISSLDAQFVNDGAIMRYNKKYLRCMGPTNIISFPGDCGESGILILSLDALHREAFLYGQDATIHLVRLLAHGMAHLAGHEHGAELDSLSSACMTSALRRLKFSGD